MYLEYEWQLLPMTAILDLFFKKTLKVTNNFRNGLRIKNHVEMRYHIKIYV